MRICDGTCDACGDPCSTGTIDEYIAEQCATDPQFAAAFAEAQRELAAWLAQPADAGERA